MIRLKSFADICAAGGAGVFVWQQDRDHRWSPAYKSAKGELYEVRVTNELYRRDVQKHVTAIARHLVDTRHGVAS